MLRELLLFIYQLVILNETTVRNFDKRSMQSCANDRGWEFIGSCRVAAKRLTPTRSKQARSKIRPVGGWTRARKPRKWVAASKLTCPAALSTTRHWAIALDNRADLLTRPPNSAHCFHPLPPGGGDLKFIGKIPLILSFSRGGKGPHGCRGTHNLPFSSVT